MSWTDSANCRGEDLDLFYPERGRYITKRAAQLCGACLVRAECLAYAMQREGPVTADSRAGVWGGLTPDERARIYYRSKKVRA